MTSSVTSSCVLWINSDSILMSRRDGTASWIDNRVCCLTMHDVLSVENLSKKYRTTVAVDGISFAVKRNEIVGLLGPNGAGKTTTINMVLGVLKPDAGTILIEGVNIEKQR